MKPEQIHTDPIFTQKRLLVKLCNEYYLLDADMSRMAKELPAETLVFCLDETHMSDPKECIRRSSLTDHCHGCQPLIATSDSNYGELPGLNKKDIEDFVNPITRVFTLEEMEKEIVKAFIHGQGNAQMMESGLERDEVDDYMSSRMRSLSKDKAGLFVFNAVISVEVDDELWNEEVGTKHGIAMKPKLIDGYINILSINKA